MTYSPRYLSLRLGGCRDHGDEIEGLVSAAEAEFFTVYGVTANGHAEALNDTRPGTSLTEARAWAEGIRDRMGLPLYDCAFL